MNRHEAAVLLERLAIGDEGDHARRNVESILENPAVAGVMFRAAEDLLTEQLVEEAIVLSLVRRHDPELLQPTLDRVVAVAGRLAEVRDAGDLLGVRS